jgi:Ca-activated chloride channel family protein
MARAGDGNYYLIEGAADLESIFALELQGLSATFGHTVSLGIEPEGDTFIEDVLTDLERNNYGRLLLPNLISGKPVDVVFRVTIPAQRERLSAEDERKVCVFRLAWTAPESRERQVLRVSLRLPVLDEATWQALPVNPTVSEQVAHKTGLRIRARAIESMNQGDYAAASEILSEEAEHYRTAAPAAAFVDEELEEVAVLKESISEQRLQRTSKLAKFSHYRKTRGR